MHSSKQNNPQHDREPVGLGDYVVREGECLESIAVKHGHFWETIWNDSANQEIRTVRLDHNVLMAGDRLTIKPIRIRQHPGSTETKHKFRRKGVPSTFKIQLLEEDGANTVTRVCDLEDLVRKLHDEVKNLKEEAAKSKFEERIEGMATQLNMHATNIKDFADASTRAPSISGRSSSSTNG